MKSEDYIAKREEAYAVLGRMNGKDHGCLVGDETLLRDYGMAITTDADGGYRIRWEGYDFPVVDPSLIDIIEGIL